MATGLRTGAILDGVSSVLCCCRRTHRLLSAAIGFGPIQVPPPRRSLLVSPVSGICTRVQAMATELYTFGPYKIHPSEVFYSTQLSYAMVNLRPLLPVCRLFSFRCSLPCSQEGVGNGHVLVCPKREVKRFTELTVEETSDLWVAARKVGAQLELYHKASSLTFAIQDGPQAGQTVPHVHIHILPRKVGDFDKNDEIYDAIDEKEKELKDKLDLDEERKDRTSEEMSLEADEYRALFP